MPPVLAAASGTAVATAITGSDQAAPLTIVRREIPGLSSVMFCFPAQKIHPQQTLPWASPRLISEYQRHPPSWMGAGSPALEWGA
ncbi:hypothetical protein GCM10010458_01240 [Microbacterium luteolum]